jgi:hypothetical protein
MGFISDKPKRSGIKSINGFHILFDFSSSSSALEAFSVSLHRFSKQYSNNRL